ncbi:MAG: 2-oxoglutarate dehydrogenase complex dihydrolipoyllysine-residue succinyltransferase [Opitutales bacterium]
MTEVKIPSLGESISSGIIAGWQVADGDYVEAGQTLLELETDKITQELPAAASGVITLSAKEGDEVEIGTVVATIDETASAGNTATQNEPASGNGGSANGSGDRKQAPAEAQAAPQRADHEAAPGAKSDAAASAGPAAPGGGTVEIKIPALGESITSGILNWTVDEGQNVNGGDTVAELETDKITQELSAEAGGTLSRAVEDGAEVEIGQIVGSISGDGTAAASPAPSAGAPAASGSELNFPLSSAARRVATETGIDPTSVQGTGKGGRVTKGDLLAAAESGASGSTQSPDAAAQRSAASKRMDPEQAAASRPPFPTKREGTKPSQQATEERSSSNGKTTRKKMSPLRRKIAERLVNATQEAALLTTFNEVDMSAIMGLRKRYQDQFVEKHEVKLGFMSFFVKASVEALKTVPGINAQIDGDDIVQNHYYDIGVAVGTEKGLIVPVIRDCDTQSFAGIEKDIIAKAKAARGGKLTMDDLQGGVFTISNGGIYGSMLSTPLLNMPQSGILGLHNIQERPMAVNGEVVIRPMMYLALSYDHRLVDGKEAVTFLVKVKQLIEAPERLLFGI